MFVSCSTHENNFTLHGMVRLGLAKSISGNRFEVCGGVWDAALCLYLLILLAVFWNVSVQFWRKIVYCWVSFPDYQIPSFWVHGSMFICFCVTLLTVGVIYRITLSCSPELSQVVASWNCSFHCFKSVITFWIWSTACWSVFHILPFKINISRNSYNSLLSIFVYFQVLVSEITRCASSVNNFRSLNTNYNPPANGELSQQVCL